MKAGLQVRFENHGHLIPKWREATTRRDYLDGEFTLAQEYVDAFKRHSDVARLRDASGADLAPPVIDAVVRHVIEGELAVTGLELDPRRDCWTAQSWRVQLGSAFAAAMPCFGDDGRVRGRHHTDAPGTAQYGAFSLREAYSDVFKRATLIATLHLGLEMDVLPSLVDAAVRYVGQEEFTVSGLAYEPLRNRWTAQSWRVRPQGDDATPEHT